MTTKKEATTQVYSLVQSTQASLKPEIGRNRTRPSPPTLLYKLFLYCNSEHCQAHVSTYPPHRRTSRKVLPITSGSVYSLGRAKREQPRGDVRFIPCEEVEPQRDWGRAALCAKTDHRRAVFAGVYNLDTKDEIGTYLPHTDPILYCIHRHYHRGGAILRGGVNALMPLR